MESLAEMFDRYLLAVYGTRSVPNGELEPVRRAFYAGFDTAFCLHGLSKAEQHRIEDELDEHKRLVARGER